jgi:hypothetical protein
MNTLTASLLRPGPAGIVRTGLRFMLRTFHGWRTRAAQEYQPPTKDELLQIERRLGKLGVPCKDLLVDPAEFREFTEHFPFPPDYHGGVQGGVYHEKLLEHFIAWRLLGLGESYATPYVDVAACNSPWAQQLRCRNIEAYAVDLHRPTQFSKLPYYRQENATRTSFADESIASASLQCAYEMFLGDDDVRLIAELGRILRPGGKVVICPLYMHTHDCYYQTQEYFGQPYGDARARGYVRRDAWGVPASRKYSPESLKTRVIDTALRSGLNPHLYVLRNAGSIADGIYMHFVLLLEKAAPQTAPRLQV